MRLTLGGQVGSEPLEGGRPDRGCPWPAGVVPAGAPVRCLLMDGSTHRYFAASAALLVWTGPGLVAAVLVAAAAVVLLF